MASPGTDATLQAAPDSSGKNIDMTSRTIAAITVYTQRNNIVDPVNDQCAGVDTSNSLQVTQGGLTPSRLTSTRAANTCSQISTSARRLFRIINTNAGQANPVAVYDDSHANGTAVGSLTNLVYQKTLGPAEVVTLDIALTNGLAVVPVTAALVAGNDVIFTWS